MSKILSSWKEIAQYLGKGVRTVQRWEQSGLPVKRPSNGPQAIIAYTDEIDAWISAGFRDTCTELQARVSELQAEIARLKAHPPLPPAANSVHESRINGTLLRATSARLRVEAVRLHIETCRLLCDTADGEMEYGQIKLAGKIVRRIKRAIETMKRRLDEPHHLPPAEANKFKPVIIRLEARVNTIEAQLTKSLRMMPDLAVISRSIPGGTIH